MEDQWSEDELMVEAAFDFSAMEMLSQVLSPADPTPAPRPMPLEMPAVQEREVEEEQQAAQLVEPVVEASEAAVACAVTPVEQTPPEPPCLEAAAPLQQSDAVTAETDAEVVEEPASEEAAPVETSAEPAAAPEWDAPIAALLAPRELSPAAAAAIPAEPSGETATARSLAALVSEIEEEIRNAPMPAAAAATSAPAQDRRTAGAEHVVFTLGGSRFATPLLQVLAIDRVPPVTPIPGLPEFVNGVTNIRGEIVALLDLRMLLGVSPPEQRERERMMIVRPGATAPAAALVVDDVTGIASVPPEDVQPVSETLDAVIAPLLRGVWMREDRMVNVLELSKVFQVPGIRQLTQV